MNLRPVTFLVVMTTLATTATAGDFGNPLLVPDRIYSAQEVLSTTQADGAELDLTPGPKAKNGKLAMLYSFLIPGMGEYYLGHKGRATAFFAADALIWTSFFVFRSQGGHREDLYHEFAQVHAGVADRNDDDFYRTIGNFVGSDGPFSANEQIRREARAIWPNEPDKQEEYIRDNGYSGNDAWQWDNESNLDRYSEMRKSSLDAYENSQMSLALLLANRLISVVDVGLLASKQNSSQNENESKLSWNVSAGRQGPNAQVVLSRNF